MYDYIRQKIIYDLTALDEQQFIQKYLGVEMDHQDLIIDEYGYFYIPISSFLSNFELDISLNLLYYNPKLYNGCDQYQDAADFLHEYMDFGTDNYIIPSEPGYLTINTYNYDSILEEILQYTLVYDNINDIYYLALEVHQGGDARINYSHVFFFKFTGDIDYFYNIQENCYIEIENCDLSIDINSLDSSFYNHKTYETIYFNCYDLPEILEILIKNNIKVTGGTFEY